MKCIYLFLFVFISSVQLYAQTDVKVDLANVSSAKFFIYSPPAKAAKIYKDTLEAVNATPEQLMSSILSADNQAWINYNTKGGAEMAEQKNEQHFTQVKSRKRDQNYFELFAKLEFTYAEREMAIVKFYINLEEKLKPIAGAMVMEKLSNGKWKIVTEPALTPISLSMMIFKTEVLKNLLTNSAENQVEKQLLKIAYTAAGLNFDSLINKRYSAEEKEVLTNPLNW